MEVIIFDRADDVVRAAAQRFESLVTSKPTAVLGLSTGDIQPAVYRMMVDKHRRGSLSFEQCTCFNLSEFIPFDGGGYKGHRTTLKREFFDLVDVKSQNTYLQTYSESITASMNIPLYEQAIKSAGGIDLQMFDIGSDGRVGFNEPLCSFASRTRVRKMRVNKQLDSQKIEPVNQRNWVMTMGIGTILDTRSVMLTAVGEDKSRAVCDAIEGPISNLCPASALQLHKRVTYLLDYEAASKLKNLDYYYHAKSDKFRWVGQYGNFYAPDFSVAH